MRDYHLGLWTGVGVLFGIANYFLLDRWERFVNQLFGFDRQQATAYYWWDEFRQWVPLSIWGVVALIVIATEAWRLRRPAVIALYLIIFLVVANLTFYLLYAVDSIRQSGPSRITVDVLPGLVFWTVIGLFAGGIAGWVGGFMALPIVRRLRARQALPSANE